MDKLTTERWAILGIFVTLVMGFVPLYISYLRDFGPVREDIFLLTGSVEAIQDQLQQVEANVSALSERLTELESAPSTDLPSGPVWLQLVSLRCHEPEDAGGDEAFLRVGGRRVWSRSMDRESVENLLTLPAIQFAETTNVSLWDEDGPQWLDSDDYLGTVQVSRDQLEQGDVTGSFTLDGANYELTYRVISSPNNVS
ncbi:hypothetical protein [Candidatus Palauibacter sp.]|uniref:hypothetical protein n=1 Tax=Candidatus Palauibacter sp. TaxID=3101350 RepID=UPI003D110FB6